LIEVDDVFSHAKTLNQKVTKKSRPISRRRHCYA
jgi:hypothetical protein